MKNRIYSYDLIRCVGALFVCSVHSVWYSGFYNVPIESFSAFIILIFRSFICCSLPLFLFLTGILMRKKEISKKYYFGLFKIYFTYLLCAIVCIAARWQITGVKGSIWEIFDFSASVYGWYINMYIGLFMIIPFLNILYNNMTNKQKKVLVVTLQALTSLPVTINYIIISQGVQKQIIPNWWVFLYPIALYMLGVYLHENPIKFSKGKWVLILAGSVALETALLYFYNSGGKIVFMFGDDIGDKMNLFSLINGLSLYHLMKDVNIKNRALQFGVSWISRLTFPILLLSIIFDSLFYNNVRVFSFFPTFNELFGLQPGNLLYLFISIPALFLLTAVLALPVDLLVSWSNNRLKKILFKEKGEKV